VNDGGCQFATYDPVFGTLAPSSSAHLQQSVTAPAHLVNVASPSGTALSGLFDDYQVRPLGTLGALDAGASIADVRAPPDRTGSVALSSYLATNGRELLAGYTLTGGTTGNVALIDLTDGGVRYIESDGNLSAAGISDGFAIDATSLGSAGSTAAIYLLDTIDGGMSTLATFDPTWTAASGFSAVTSTGVLVLDYFNLTDQNHYVRAAAPLLYSPAVSSGTPLDLMTSTDVTYDVTITGVGALGTDMLVYNGGLRDGTQVPYTFVVFRVPLAVSGTTITVGVQDALMSTMDQCTNVLFTAPLGNDALFGIEDQNGRRIVRLSP
jgi:hypothetical protein